MEETVERLAELIGHHRVAVVTDDVVNRLYGPPFLRALAKVGIDAQVAVVPAGEANKSMAQAIALWNWLAAGTLSRHDVIVAFGGGVIIDLGGWVASGYMRGMSYVNVPTTLVGQVDAGIGGKLAVNHREAKNLIGGFHQPRGVLSHVGFLDSLGIRHIRAGLAETIKKALIASPEYWEFLEANVPAIVAGDHDVRTRLVATAGVIKAELIARDPYERDQRRTLGFGHALAHPIETVTGYGPVLHGEAVAMGMVIEAHMANALGLLDADTHARILALVRRAGLATSARELPVPVRQEPLLRAAEKIELARGGALRWVLPCGIGHTAIADHLPPELLRNALLALGFDN
ncbi:MAG TPA: 3-dehydroquinate synthase family protein [Solirubrobacteraceae bacterium]|nr:3-dehydroquinate synthase family protein [Solirubrobacteraceae bacterium]